jgi:RNA polymerase sigma-70 factor (ECF subfamily)
MVTTRVEAFLSHVGDRSRAHHGETRTLDDALATVTRRARDAWPDLAVDDETFASYLAARVGDDGPIEDALARLPAADVYLACACARGDSDAIRAFEARYFGEVDLIVARVRDVVAGAEEVRQMIREKLFVKAGDAPPKIADYTGEGALAAWFRVTTMRMVLNLRRDTKEIPVDDDKLLDLAACRDDAELAHLKRMYRAEFKAAFDEAVGALEAREKNLLHFAFVEGLGGEAIGTILGVHKATVNRRLVDLRGVLLKGIRTAMLKNLRVSRDELESILRLIQSNLEITLGGGV